MISKQKKAFVGMPWEGLRKKAATKRKEEFSYTIGKSSLGVVLVAWSEFGIVSILLGDKTEELIKRLEDRFPQNSFRKENGKVKTALTRVIRFIEKPSSSFDLPLNMRGTPFQRRVWEAAQKIPLGATSTYSDIARLIRSPLAMRAVGSACTNNHFSIVVPCHRILHKGQSLAAGLSKSSKRQQALIKREVRGKKK